MKAYVVRNPTALAPFQRPASTVRFKDGSIGARLRHQLGRGGFTVVELGALDLTAIEPGSIVVQDDVVFSRRFLGAFVRAIADRRKNYRCEIDASRFALLSPKDPAASFRALPVTYYGDPSSSEVEALRLTPTTFYAMTEGLPARMHMLTELRVYFLDYYAIDVRYWFDLQTATSLYSRELVSNLVRLAYFLLPAFLLSWVLTRRWILERSNSIGKNCRIHPTAILEGCVIGDNVEIGPFTYMRLAVLGDGVVVREKATVKGSYVGERAFLMASDIVNSYVGAETAVVCPMLFNVVFGERGFISGGSGFADFILGSGQIKAQIDGKEIPSNLSFLGSGVGDDCFLGANLIFAPGRTIPDGTRILDNGLIKSVPGVSGGAFVLSGTTLLQIPDNFLGQKRP
jgi:acetyltransferase-like isoleucine patch superfamily enzyme